MSVRGVFVDANGSLADIFERQNKAGDPAVHVNRNADIKSEDMPALLGGAEIVVIDHTSLPTNIARRCNGLPVLTNTIANCGVCGIQCATAGVTSAQDCQLLSGHYQCVDCAANNECWSGCCAIDTTPYHCSASDCNTGACVAGLCPAPSTCVLGASAPNYCTYD